MLNFKHIICKNTAIYDEKMLRGFAEQTLLTIFQQKTYYRN